jgi:class 3 adenylate cyclase
MTSEQRRLAAIVSADVEGYLRLMGRDESGRLAVLKAPGGPMMPTLS